LNPNYNREYDPPIEVKRDDFLTTSKREEPDRTFVTIPGNKNILEHCLYVWDNIINECVASQIAIVAHSAGGYGTYNLLQKRYEAVNSRVSCVAFTDSVHDVGASDGKLIKAFFQKKCKNWVCSDKPAGEFIAKPFYDCIKVSAGHMKHEYTSGYAIDSVFEFIVEKTSETKETKETKE